LYDSLQTSFKNPFFIVFFEPQTTINLNIDSHVQKLKQATGPQFFAFCFAEGNNNRQNIVFQEKNYNLPVNGKCSYS